MRTTAVTRALAAAAVWGCCSGAVAHAQSTPEDRIVAFADIRAAVFKVATLTGMVVALELSDGAARPIHDDGTCPGATTPTYGRLPVSSPNVGSRRPRSMACSASASGPGGHGADR